MLRSLTSRATWSVMRGNDRQDPTLASDRQAQHQSDCAAPGCLAQHGQEVPQEQRNPAQVQLTAETLSGDGAVGSALTRVVARGCGQAAARVRQYPLIQNRHLLALQSSAILIICASDLLNLASQ